MAARRERDPYGVHDPNVQYKLHPHVIHVRSSAPLKGCSDPQKRPQSGYPCQCPTLGTRFTHNKHPAPPRTTHFQRAHCQRTARRNGLAHMQRHDSARAAHHHLRARLAANFTPERPTVVSFLPQLLEARLLAEVAPPDLQGRYCV
ncbi:predicted protein [Plenodomus lingam JN3]|uniref:Predicted protein n=1 Tax=Leptosphaeria maculans (strain JN3 / isolate v23.1.3 / race Av1-4-5-6-7-8) TaxID=985895 RepID=E4ZHN1_LEPMJ|nr:predicted protein [Plenodomus lingam JN3]CBX90864.1 predicted protein [Plenodomus lingam JN3]